MTTHASLISAAAKEIAETSMKESGLADSLTGDLAPQAEHPKSTEAEMSMTTKIKSRPIILPGGDAAIRALRDGRLRAFVVPIDPPIESPYCDDFSAVTAPSGRATWHHDYEFERFVWRHCPFRAGEAMWVREAWRMSTAYVEGTEKSGKTYWAFIEYRDGSEARKQITKEEYEEHTCEWRPARSMPQEFSRFTVKILSVKAVRVAEMRNPDVLLALGIIDNSYAMPATVQFQSWWTATNPACPFEGAWGWLCGVSLEGK